jgi:hypothetical protein
VGQTLFIEILELRGFNCTEKKWSGRRGSNSQLYFQQLQNTLEKMCVHALHTVHALPDLRIWRDVCGTVCQLSTQLTRCTLMCFNRFSRRSLYHAILYVSC